MASHPVPGEPPRLRDFFKWDLPDRADASPWCGKHPRERTVLVARAQWVCQDCVREDSRPG